MASPEDEEMLNDLPLLLSWDLLEREEDWDIFLAIDDTPPPKPKPAPPVKKKEPGP